MRRRVSVLSMVIVTVWLAGAVLAQPGVPPVLEFARARDPGIVTLILHARASKTGAPQEFRLEDCATQRNLSAEGRQDARRLGEVLRSVGVRDAQVLSSQWCRCLETARLLGVGPVVGAPYLNAFLPGRDDADTATRELRVAVLGKLDSRRPTLFITHEVNITALTGIVPAEGEAIFVRATATGAVDVAGRARLP